WFPDAVHFVTRSPVDADQFSASTSTRRSRSPVIDRPAESGADTRSPVDPGTSRYGPPSRIVTRSGVFRPISPYSGLIGFRGENRPSRLFISRLHVDRSTTALDSADTPRVIVMGAVFRPYTYSVMSS